ncbi:ABC transporter permease [Yinghuangia seranimata]|uniref:ABC transporter permease n=1 Tax=Yinghuangia seranimata TaxID=408067 RepID=UPI00248CA763|nr:ABC transporter permease [Yinghuangia seranimata]MDI2132905.1 ABC transporter permease [Yinghuangia seranimata]
MAATDARTLRALGGPAARDRARSAAEAGRPARERLPYMVHAEWTKLRTLPTTWLILAAAVLLTTAIGAAATSGLDPGHCRGTEPCAEDIVKQSLTGVLVGQVVVAILAIHAVCGEYATGTIRTTLTAMPDRVRVLVAKAVVVGGLTAAAGAAGVGAALGTARFVLLSQGFDHAHGYAALTLADGATARAAVGSVLNLVLVGWLTLGLAWLVRDSAGAIGSVLGLLYLSPVLASLANDPTWQHRLRKYGPGPAGLSVQNTLRLDRLDIGPWPGLGVLAAYTGAALLVGGLALCRRDA